MQQFFDSYGLRAKLFPAFLTVLPITLLASSTTASVAWAVGGGGLSALGVSYFVANWVRDRGKDLEDRLAIEWDGMPTTRRLRWRGNGATPQFLRRRERLERFVGRPLPDQAAERGDAAGADAEYEEAVKEFILSVRDGPDRDPRVHGELTSYGFRRNLLAMKPFGLVLSGVALVADVIAAVWGSGVTTALSLGAAHLLIVLSWLLLVTKQRVARQSEVYADRLFEALARISGGVT